VVWAAERQFAPTTTSPAQAREFAARELLRFDRAYLVDNVRLVVSEVVTDAGVHARTPIRSLKRRTSDTTCRAMLADIQGAAPSSSTPLDIGERGLASRPSIVRIPNGANSGAKASMQPSTPNFEAAKGEVGASLTKPDAADAVQASCLWPSAGVVAVTDVDGRGIFAEAFRKPRYSVVDHGVECPIGHVVAGRHRQSHLDHASD
jgi:hypothetical protein